MNYLCRGFTFKTLNNWYVLACHTTALQYQCSVRLCIDSDLRLTEMPHPLTNLSTDMRRHCRFSRIIFNIWSSLYYTIELIMTIMMAPLHTLYNIIVVSKVQCLILIHFKTIITPWMIFPPDYKYLYIGRTAGHTVCHRLVTQSSSKWTLPVAGVGAVVIMLRILFKF